MADWKLRTGNADDVQALYELDLLCFDEPFRFALRSMRRFVTRIGAIVLVAEAGAGLAGFAIVHLERQRREIMGYVVTLDVAPRFRRQGLAQALLAEAETRVLDAHGAALALHVYTGNAAAIAFYEASGYQRGTRSAGFYGEGLDAWSYAKPIAIDGGEALRTNSQ